MDYKARKKFVQHVLALFDAEDMLPSVPLDDYLSGNTDDASLGKGMARDFNLRDYADSLRALAARPEVTGIWVEVHELPDVNEPADDDIWAQAFKVHVVTSLSKEAVQCELDSLKPRAVSDGWGVESGVQVPTVRPRPGHRVIRVEFG